MTRLSKACLSGATALLFGVFSSLALAADREDFVNEASAKALAEIESAQLALETSQSEDIREFAQMMIDDHTKSREKLAELAAGDDDLELADNATLMDRAKVMILELRDGESFDQAYANNQVNAHEQTLELYREYAREGEHEELSTYAEGELSTLEEHLEKARELQNKYANQ
ncbi:DUF4142 domain-containing protein [Stutzerimonas tarimensis]|uniref:DUF4142 domain-containing protein n=1 Tax=Stutzerimonas tarimensis TaxID=1507735 RepID=A0ABV7T7I1_9GAMM